ncbi:hypothetical protein ACJ73_07014 [Blastomyces percursus]|uniref:Uncharacterized protein n=1 Tax=Blastomyces percursus TaxID=1658174 RepID=A0A1J9QN59_9EURO|nr:hypothetical protein ACJ73_07014 [Blastomyces percursus]
MPRMRRPPAARLCTVCFVDLPSRSRAKYCDSCRPTSRSAARSSRTARIINALPVRTLPTPDNTQSSPAEAVDSTTTLSAVPTPPSSGPPPTRVPLRRAPRAPRFCFNDGCKEQTADHRYVRCNLCLSQSRLLNANSNSPVTPNACRCGKNLLPYPHITMCSTCSQATGELLEIGDLWDHPEPSTAPLASAAKASS